MLILLAYVGGHICFSFQPAEPKVERWENMIVIIIVLKELYKYFEICSEYSHS